MKSFDKNTSMGAFDKNTSMGAFDKNTSMGRVMANEMNVDLENTDDKEEFPDQSDPDTQNQ